MRIIHTSDTHLGHQQYTRLDGDGLNQREQDHYAAFHKVIDYAVASKADLFLHAGDLFDGVRPSNRALSVAMEGFLKLSRAGIPTVIIAGNHEHPKLRETGSPFRLFEHLPNIHPVFRGKRETLQLAGLNIHAVPQCADAELLAAEIESAPEPKDILVVHGAVTTVAAFSHAEFNELTLSPKLFEPFGYVALGHFHGTKQVAPNAWYCGAPDRVSISESGEEKGFLEITVDGSHYKAALKPLDGRPYADLPPIDATGLTSDQVRDAVRQAVARLPDGAVARQRVNQLEPTLRGSLDLRAMQEAGKHLLHLDLSKFEWQTPSGERPGSDKFRPLADEFAEFLATESLPGADRDAILQRARQLLEAA